MKKNKNLINSLIGINFSKQKSNNGFLFSKPSNNKGLLISSFYPNKMSRRDIIVQADPLGDIDKDGVPNWVDCAPFNRNKQGWNHKNGEEKGKSRLVFPKKPSEEAGAQMKPAIQATKGERVGKRKLFIKSLRSQYDTLKAKEAQQKAKEVLMSPEEKKYKQEKEAVDTAYTQRRTAEIERQRKDIQFAKSRTGRVGAFVKKWAYQRPLRNPSVLYQRKGETGTSSRGRPAGSYKSQYAAYGGVYGYRKRMAFERKMALAKAQTTPQQQMILEQVRRREEAQQMDPERQPIPNTFGTVRLKHIHDEADAAAHAFE